jgi:two-component system phosphate regulon sensor histidine kinase PhoR
LATAASRTRVGFAAATLAALLALLAALWLGGWGGALGCLAGMLLLHVALGAARLRQPGHAEVLRTAAERRRLQAVFDASLEGVIALDTTGRVVLMNAAAGGLLDLSPPACKGRLIGDVSDNPEISRVALEALQSGETSAADVNWGARRLQVYARSIPSEHGVVLVVHDVSEMRRLESLRRDFVANVSHELKTPLTSIRAYVDTLLDGGIDDHENNRRFLRKIETHVQRLVVLITDLLSLSRIESGEAITEHSRIDVLDPLRDTCSRLAPSAEQKTVRLEIQAPEDPLEALGDTETFQQIFDNLIDNAIKYTNPGGSVTVAARREGPRVRIDVCDTGVGIPQEDLPRIFERFYRVDRARARELGGTGLGLSIVKHSVQALGGEIRVESELGKGSAFTVRFPGV